MSRLSRPVSFRGERRAGIERGQGGLAAVSGIVTDRREASATGNNIAKVSAACQQIGSTTGGCGVIWRTFGAVIRAIFLIFGVNQYYFS